ncbi:hypothetical protein O0882_15800 [Janthinobacterium sp. SUN073]|uniref:hypothetical protein n=1 Tax=Janthinobacterium sp. SUN073 TaxID=3004102 RepID=UPI0025B052F3|nr:hypothetical protein [Janthinobacterium sp. SUN073]MDN2697783.1 hypothetical protein [Janthinobacterium sp. SUN073]
MTKQLKIRNQHGELVIDSNTYGTHCIGRATFVSLQQPYSSGGGMVSGFSTYQFSGFRGILWVIDLPVDRRVGVIKTSYVNGVHTLTVYCGANADENGGFDQQEPVTIWAFATITEKVAARGLLLRHSVTNAVTHDFGTPTLTFPLALGGLENSVVVSSVGRPVALGASPFYEMNYVGTGGQYTMTASRRFLVRRSNGVIAYAPALMLRSGLMSGTLPPDTVYSEPSPFFVLDGTNLP